MNHDTIQTVTVPIIDLDTKLLQKYSLEILQYHHALGTTEMRLNMAMFLTHLICLAVNVIT